MNPIIYVGIANQDVMPNLNIKVPNQSVLKIVCNEFGYSYIDVMNKHKKRDADLKNARQIYFYIQRNTSQLGLKVIGSFFSKHHSTVVHGVGLTTDLMSVDAVFRIKVEKCIKEVKLLKIALSITDTAQIMKKYDR